MSRQDSNMEIGRPDSPYSGQGMSKPNAASVQHPDHSDLASRSEQMETGRRLPPEHIHTARSIPNNFLADQSQPRSPRERLDDLLALEDSGQASRGVRGIGSVERTLSQSSQSSKPPIYDQLRNPPTRLPPHQPGRASPSSPPSMNSAAPVYRPARPIPRTSSIDSAISSISSSTSYSQKPSPENVPTTATDIAHLISTAGSAEAVIEHLLKEKQSSTSQNSQLWRLVNKQRAMIMGLNKDLERAMKEKEQYRNQMKELLRQASSGRSNVPNHAGPATPRPQSELPSIADGHHGSASANHTVADISARLRETEPSEEMKPAIAEQAMATHGASTAHQPSHLAEQSQYSPAEADDIRNTYVPIGKSFNDLPPGTSNNGTITNTTPASPPPTRTDELTPEQQRGAISPNSFSAKRSLAASQQALESPSFSEVQGQSGGSPRDRIPPPPRKPPPAPLHLSQPNRASPPIPQAEIAVEDSGSDYDNASDVEETPTFEERGRRKTREDDDREREALMVKELEHRSRSKAEMSANPAVPQALPDAGTTTAQEEGQIHGHALSVPPRHRSPPGSLAAAMNPTQPRTLSALPSHLVSAPPMSPGLPMSPRPGDRPMNSPLPRMPREGHSIGALGSPPMSPRPGFPGLPLSPRAPRHPIPLPYGMQSTVNTSVAAETSSASTRPEPNRGDSYSNATRQPSGSLSSQNGGSPVLGLIYRGFITEQWPDLLLPPNAIPLVDVRVLSSRLKPSRLSYIAPKSSDEERVLTLGIFNRSDDRELWRIEKPLQALPQLHAHLRKCPEFKADLPDKDLFTGHSPTKIDARRIALDGYLEAILDAPLEEKVALAFCNFLSTNAIGPGGDETVVGKASPDIESTTNQSSPVMRKEGYLTKKGKNFGGWKARFFSLDGQTLKYYESPNGAHLGTIKLQNAQIGRQTQQQENSPSRGDDDADGQFRHAFLILEPKKKDSSSLMRHVLCAESDAERDEWVDTLIQAIRHHTSEDELRGPTVFSDASASSSNIGGQQGQTRNYSGNRSDNRLRDEVSDEPDVLRGISYEDTVAAEAPVRGSTPSRSLNETPSPPNTSVPSQSKSISGPTNGAKIQDAEAWGNKSAAKDKEHKKRSIWGFRGRGSSDLAIQSPTGGGSNNGSPQQTLTERGLAARAAFGAPLAEAVEYCRPVGVDVFLPAVVYRCIEYLDAKDAFREEGIFRLSGSNVVIKALKERFNTEGDINFLTDEHQYDVHAVASLLKLYLRELPSSVLTRELHLDFLQVLDVEDREQKLDMYNVLVHKLPPENWEVLKVLSSFLLNIVNHSDINKMTVRNVGIVFSPTLNIPAPIFSMFLTDFDRIFASELDESHSPTIEVSAAPLTPEDIRSPRRQMFSELPTPSYNQTSFRNQQQQQQVGRNPSSNAYDTGFIPLQPSYEPPTPSFQPTIYAQGTNSPSFPPSSGDGFASLNGALSSGTPQSAKARRRESSMLAMGMGGVPSRGSVVPMVSQSFADRLKADEARH
ncbi:MAG: hypothetical protein M1819_002270 [Sarea resinae]|nr:MAG: hypothetical protein M1819_002270 [Sarea resinae]